MNNDVASTNTKSSGKLGDEEDFSEVKLRDLKLYFTYRVKTSKSGLRPSTVLLDLKLLQMIHRLDTWKPHGEHVSGQLVKSVRLIFINISLIRPISIYTLPSSNSTSYPTFA